MQNELFDFPYSLLPPLPVIRYALQSVCQTVTVTHIHSLSVQCTA